MQEQWSPPAAPDPSEILNEAETDAAAGRYELALQKHVWFHGNALRYARSLSGVRSSFALHAWKELAVIYPPAMAALIAERDKLMARIRDGTTDYNVFSDLSSINGYLGNEAQTVEAFLHLEATAPAVARRVAHVVREKLIRAGRLDLAAKYVDGVFELTSAMSCFNSEMTMERQDTRRPELAGWAKTRFIHEIGTVVALLVFKLEPELAGRIANTANAFFPDPDLQEALSKARDGIIPPDPLEAA